MTKKLKASFTNNPLEYSPGDKVIQIYPVARPMIGLVVGSNKVEGKVYVNWNGRTMQVDPEEIQLAIGTPFFPISRTASKSEERKLEKIVIALAETESPHNTQQFHIEFEKNLIKAGIANDEADDISRQYQDGFNKRVSVACLDPVPPVAGEPVIVLNNSGSGPGKVGILVGAEGADAIVDLDTSWSPTSNGSQLFRVPMVAVVPVQGALRERLNSNACCASIDIKKQRKASPKVAAQAFDLFMTSVKSVDVVDVKDFKAWVETTALSTGEVIVSAVIEKGGECDPLLKIFPIFNQKLAGFNIQNETDYKNAVQRVIPLIDNCKSSILQYFQENIIPGYVENEVKRNLTASSKVIIHDLNNDTKYEITDPKEAKDNTDKSAAIEAFKSGETVSMGKVVAEYVASIKTASLEYELKDLGVENEQYFQGAGTSFTEWDDVYVGIGSSPYEAAEDALDNAADSGKNVDDIKNDMSKKDTVPEDSEGIYQYVGLYLKDGKTASIKTAKLSELAQIFVDRDDMTEQEAKDYVKELQERVADGENPEEVLYDEGLEPDYIFDLI